MKDLTESEVQERWRIVVLCIPKVPLCLRRSGFAQAGTRLREETRRVTAASRIEYPPGVPAESVLALYCNVEVNPVVAVILGHLLAAEPLTPRILIAATTMAGSVALTTLSQQGFLRTKLGPKP